MENITDAIANAYFADNGFRSVQHTYKQAKAWNPAVTLKHVKDWFEGRLPVERNSEASTATSPTRPGSSTKPISSS